MYKLNEIKERKKFIFQEKIVLAVFGVFCFILAISRYTWYIIQWWFHTGEVNLVEKYIFFFGLDAIHFVSLILMIIIFIVLISKLHQFYREEYKMNIKSMMFFLAFETPASFLFIVNNYFVINQKFNNFSRMNLALILIGFFPI